MEQDYSPILGHLIEIDRSNGGVLDNCCFCTTLTHQIISLSPAGNVPQ